MSGYSKFIAPERRSVPTPRHMVENGKCVFGTFDKEFETMDLLGIDNPTHAPDFLKKLKADGTLQTLANKYGLTLADIK